MSLDIDSLVDTLMKAHALDIRMFLLTRTRSSKPDRMFELYKINIANDAANFFKEVLLSALELLKENNNEIKDFFTEEIENSESIFELDENIVSTLPGIMNQINQHATLPLVGDIKKLKHRVIGYAIEFRTTEDHRIIYFRHATERNILSRKGLTALALYRGYFNKVEGDVFTFDRKVDCIYFIEKKVNSTNTRLIIFNKSEFETLFRMYEYYQRKTEETLKVLLDNGHIEISEDLFNKACSSVKFSKKITKIVHSVSVDQFEVAPFKKAKEVHPTLGYDISGSKVIIQDEKALRDFIDVWDDDITRSIARENKLYRVYGKEELK